MNNYKVYEQWVNGTRHWNVISTKTSFNEFWKDYKTTLERMGMKLIAMIPSGTKIDY